MKLPVETKDLKAWLEEFDVWVTPSLGGIQDTERFQREMAAVVRVFEALGRATDNFVDVEGCDPQAIASTFIELIQGDPDDGAAKIRLQELASVLFLVTGKSDNNAKCQLPLYLRDEAGWVSFPVVKRSRRGGDPVVSDGPTPRVLDTDRYMGTVASLRAVAGAQTRLQRLLEEFIRFILNNESYVSQLWSIGHSYFLLKSLNAAPEGGGGGGGIQAPGREQDLLSPLVAFQVRGSVSATGGHKLESVLRRRLDEWGLQRDVDYNVADVVVKPSGELVTAERGQQGQGDAVLDGAEEAEQAKEKTRAFDFVLPYQTAGWPGYWEQRLFIQSQFYAGDSGSVSHKVIDQTRASRDALQSKVPDAKCVEYLDGAGYYSSLNGDLKKLLQMDDTAAFFQVRSAPLRLRRELQQLRFLVPLEVMHAILCTDATQGAVRALLLRDGYSDDEVTRCFQDSQARSLIAVGADYEFVINEEWRAIARKYLLLDVAAKEGKAMDRSSLVGTLAVPGYGPSYGMKLDELMRAAMDVAPGLRSDWADPVALMGDVRWLCEERFAKMG